jgi:hypothetical protein
MTATAPDGGQMAESSGGSAHPRAAPEGAGAGNGSWRSVRNMDAIMTI